MALVNERLPEQREGEHGKPRKKRMRHEGEDWTMRQKTTGKKDQSRRTMGKREAK